MRQESIKEETSNQWALFKKEVIGDFFGKIL